MKVSGVGTPKSMEWGRVDCLTSRAEAFYASPLFHQNLKRMAAPARTGVAISLVDPITNENYKIIVDAKDAERAGKDLIFATQLFNQAKLQAAAAAKQAANAGAGSPGVSLIIAPVNAPNITPNHCSYVADAGSSAPEPTAQTVNYSDEKEDAGCNWTKPMGLLLIRTYMKNESNFTTGKMSQKQAWEQISKEMASHGYTVSGSKCASKFSSLKRTYKAVKDHNKTSGNERRTWYFLDVMDEFFSTKPWIDPVSTASSDGYKKSDSESSSQSIGMHNSSVDPKSTSKRKRGRDSLTLQLIEEKRRYREAKQRQHEEKIHEARRLTSIMEKLVKKTATFSESISDFDEDPTSD